MQIQICPQVKNVDTDFPDVLQVDENKKKPDPGTMDNLDEDEIMEFSDFSTKNGEATKTLDSTPTTLTSTTPQNIPQQTLKPSPKTPKTPTDVDSLEYQNDAPENLEVEKPKRKTLGNLMDEVRFIDLSINFLIG